MDVTARQAINVFVPVMVIFSAFTGVFAKEAVWTIDTRAAKLMQDINDGQKNGSLTLKEAKKLRGDLADIAHRKHELKGDNDGKVSEADKSKIEGDLNKVSVKLHKLELAKRVLTK